MSYRPKKGDLVYLRWLDSTHTDGMQKEDAALKDRQTMDCQSVGFYLGSRDQMHVVAHFRYMDGEEKSGHTVKYVQYIPARAVRELRQLRKVRR